MRLKHELRWLRSYFGRAPRYSEDAVAIQALASLPGPFLPWTEFSMRPWAIVAILSDIVAYERASVVECGSGNSTVYAARLFAQRGHGHVTSVDHDGHWAGLTRRLLEQEGLGEHATVVHAPLVDGWYDRAAIPAPERVDLLVVDGPPANAAAIGRSRERALDAFHDRLTADATVLLDDARRPGERAVIASWSERFGRRFKTERGSFAISAPHTRA
jgi:predicted O-methyltransferase YrrM